MLEIDPYQPEECEFVSTIKCKGVVNGFNSRTRGFR